MRPSLPAVLYLFLLFMASHSYSQPNIYRPEITGQTPDPLTTSMNQSITIKLENLIVQDRDALPVYPDGFTLEVSSGRNYEVDDATIIPDNNFIGMLRVPVRVNDGRRDSKKFNVQIEVTGSPNAVPVITGQQVLNIDQGESIEIKLSHLNVNDPDNTYPNDFTLNVHNGQDYSRSGNTITPNGNFTGTLTVGVSVNDGQNESDRFDLKIDVGETQNTAPTITSQKNLQTDEDKPFTLKLSDISITDPDNSSPNDFALIINPGSNYSVSGTTITPAQNFEGTLAVEILVNDGQSNSPPYSLQLTVNPINDPPEITNQVPLSTLQNTSLTIALDHLTVSDPDNDYPEDFVLKVSAENNYTVSGNTILPAPNFTGMLHVNVSVNDGTVDSKAYSVKINVMAAANTPPVITGQKSISLIENSSLLILLSHLIVTDPDNKYPIGFSLTVLPGDNYSVEGTTVTPLSNFKNPTLTVKVMVSDGIAESEPFDLKIQIIPATPTPTINGQKELTMLEDSSMTVTLSHVEVTDTDNPNYPKGFSLRVLPGNKDVYTVSGNTITPALHLNGFIEVEVTVSDGINISDEFKLSILVMPVNDAPEILNLETTTLIYEPGSEPIHLSQTIDLRDVDNDHLSMAEIGFRPANYSAVNDELIISTDSTNIKAIYDPGGGILFLVGYAPLEEYKTVFRSLQYNYRMTQDANGNPSEILSGTRTIYLTLNDGQLISGTYERQITMETKVTLDIPNAFTPNGDNSNDTWRVYSVNRNQLDKAVIRVYNKRGFLLYESIGFENEWDGTSNGEVLPVDTYYYTIDLNLSYMKQTYKGVVTILH